MKGGHHDIPKTFSKYNDKEHQNSKYLLHYSFKFYKTWVMYSKKQFNENTYLSVSYIFQSLMGPIKFSVMFLVGPPNCTSTFQPS
jgi:hypothetical protein